eukprot:scaffold1992_cov113-Cylindrotheca_fusiformis.AAC.9
MENKVKCNMKESLIFASAFSSLPIVLGALVSVSLLGIGVGYASTYDELILGVGAAAAISSSFPWTSLLCGMEASNSCS